MTDHTPTTAGKAETILDEYYVGLLPDAGKGNVEWWQDCIRSYLGSAYDFYKDQFDNLAKTHATNLTRITELEAEVKALREALREIQRIAADGIEANTEGSDAWNLFADIHQHAARNLSARSLIPESNNGEAGE